MFLLALYLLLAMVLNSDRLRNQEQNRNRKQFGNVHIPSAVVLCGFMPRLLPLLSQMPEGE